MSLNVIHEPISTSGIKLTKEKNMPEIKTNNVTSDFCGAINKKESNLSIDNMEGFVRLLARQEARRLFDIPN